MDVDDVQRERRERLLDRPGHVDGQRCRAPARGGEGQDLADAEDADPTHAAVGPSSSFSGCERSVRRLSRTSDADSDGATMRTW